MTQVSRFKLKPNVWEKIFDLFSDTLLNAKNKQQLDSFLDGFLSPTEKIMLSKRLAIAVLLSKGNDYQSIKETIRVTTGTIAKVNLLLKTSQGLNNIISEILKRDIGRLLVSDVIDFIDQPRYGTDWSNVAKRKIKRHKQIHDLKKGLG